MSKMRKRCNFKVPKPFVILSTKGSKKNEYRKHIIYPDLNNFKKACLNCHYRNTKDKKSSCAIRDPQFMLKFYGIIEGLPKGILLSRGTVPADLKLHSLAVEIEAYFDRHRQRSKRKSKLRTLNNNFDARSERRPCFADEQSKSVA